MGSALFRTFFFFFLMPPTNFLGRSWAAVGHLKILIRPGKPRLNKNVASRSSSIIPPLHHPLVLSATFDFSYTLPGRRAYSRQTIDTMTEEITHHTIKGLFLALASSVMASRCSLLSPLSCRTRALSPAPHSLLYPSMMSVCSCQTGKGMPHATRLDALSFGASSMTSILGLKPFLEHRG